MVCINNYHKKHIHRVSAGLTIDNTRMIKVCYTIAKKRLVTPAYEDQRLWTILDKMHVEYYKIVFYRDADFVFIGTAGIPHYGIIDFFGAGHSRGKIADGMNWKSATLRMRKQEVAARRPDILLMYAKVKPIEIEMHIRHWMRGVREWKKNTEVFDD
jgi:hypothetical protein